MDWWKILIIGIYKVINDIFSDMLKKYGYQYSYKLKSNIHPSIVYKYKNYKLQIGFNYENRTPFAIFWGNDSFTCPSYIEANASSSIKKKLQIFCNQIDFCLESNQEKENKTD